MDTIYRFRIERIKFFLALSRTPHGLLDMATPAFAALIYLGGFPPARIMLIGLLTAFAGYTAVYAANDVIDYRSDRKRLTHQDTDAGSYIDSLMIRHPMAQGFLSYTEGLVWAAGWSVVAIVGAWLLNPVCALIFLAGAALEAVYCMLWRVSPFRTVVSGFVKTMGAIAAVFAVDPHPDPVSILILFSCFFFWEIGGQNIPHDWSDIEEDRRFEAKTIPVQMGEERSAALSFACVLLAAILCTILFFIKFSSMRGPALTAALAVCGVLLLAPGWRLFQTRSRASAMALFNRASYFPAALLGAVLILIMS